MKTSCQHMLHGNPVATAHARAGGMDPCAPDRSLPMHSTKSGGSPAAAASCRMRSTIRPLLTPWQAGTKGVK